MLVVADASPLIFLAKIAQLGLLRRLFGAVLIPAGVRAEVLCYQADPAERKQLAEFLEHAEVVQVRQPHQYAAALSRADREAINLAVKRKAKLLLADDRLVRRLAQAEGVQALGTIGILLEAVWKRVLASTEAKDHLQCLVRDHRMRIAVAVYAAAMAAFDALDSPSPDHFPAS
jgi:predicted nucleic acid-binding protein